MGNEWKMVPVEPTDDMIVAFAEGWYSKSQCIDDPDMLDAYRDMLAAAPVPPAGGEQIPTAAIVGSHQYIGFPDYGVNSPAVKMGNMLIDLPLGSELVDRAHITRLTAERDGLQARLEEALADCEANRHEREVVCTNYEVMQSELTKARDALAGMVEYFPEGHSDGECFSVERAKAVLAHQSAPAAKGGDRGEPLCLLCLDKKTVPGPEHGDFALDCPDCCSEEG